MLLSLNVSEKRHPNRATERLSYVFDGCTINSKVDAASILSLVPRHRPSGQCRAHGGNLREHFNLPKNGCQKYGYPEIAGNWDGANLSDAGREMITFSDNTVTAYAVVRIHSSMSGNTSDSVKYIAKFSNNNLKDVC